MSAAALDGRAMLLRLSRDPKVLEIVALGFEAAGPHASRLEEAGRAWVAIFDAAREEAPSTSFPPAIWEALDHVQALIALALVPPS